RPVEEQAVARRQGRNVLREVGREKALPAGSRVAQAPRSGERRQKGAGPGVASRPPGGGPVVEHLPVEWVVRPRQGQGVGEREIRGGGLLGDGECRTDGEPDGQE